MELRALGPVLAAAVISLTAPAVAAATDISVAPGAPDDAGNPAACAALAGGAFQCPTLRDAVAFANGLFVSSPVIQLSAGTYSLVNGPIAPTTAMTISGAGDSGATGTTIRQGGVSGVISASDSLTLNSLIVTGGDVVGADATTGSPASSIGGAGVAMEGASSVLTLNGVAVTDNRAVGGDGLDQTATTSDGVGGPVAGAAISASGPLSITNSTISGNSGLGGAGGGSSGSNPAGGGGAAAGVVLASDAVTVTGSTISDNFVTGGAGGAGDGTGDAGAGGGAFSGGLSVGKGGSLSHSTISGNVVTGGAGGGASGNVFNAGAGGPALGGGLLFLTSTAGQSLSVDTTTISGNTVLGGAGGAAGGTNRIAGTGGAGGFAGGGGLEVDTFVASSAVVTNSTISGNTASAGAAGDDTSVASGAGGAAGPASGGGILDGDITPGVPLAISASTISGNQAISSSGGAGGASGSTGADSDSSGGGLTAAAGATVTVVNSTVFGNSAQSGTGDTSTGTPGSFGGGIDATDAGTTVGLFSDTIAGNQASAGAGSLFVFGPDLNAFGSAAYTLQDTVIAAPVPSNQSACTSEGGVFTDLGHNLEDSTFSTCGLSGAANNDQLIADDQLASTLGANGGATMTLAPAATSPVIGNGGACTNPLASPTSSPLGVDQRGAPRGATCDIGAFQTEPISVTGAPVITGTAAIGETLTCASGTFSTGGDGAFTATGAIGAPTITNAFASNGTPVSSGNTYTVAPADQGHTITCSETATGAYGRGQATSAPVSVPATPVSVPAASASIPAAPVNVKLSIVSQAHSKWAEKKRKHGLPVGTSFTYTLNTPATVTLTITRQASGRQVKGQCVTQTRHNRHASRCTLTSKAGTLTGPGQVGANTVRFTGKIGSHRIAAGSYQLTITAKTPTGTSIAALSFTISR